MGRDKLNKPKNSGATRAQKIAAAKAESNRASKRVWIVASIVIIAIIAGVTAAIMIGSKKTPVTTAQITPPHIAADKNGINAYPEVTAKEDALIVEVYQDYQCPACKMIEDGWGKYFHELAKSGDIKLQYNTMTFLDFSNKKSKNKESSTRSAQAASCADTVNKYAAYHDAVYANQPQREGDGFSDKQLRSDFAKDAGITGQDLEKFQSCYDNKSTQKFVQETYDKASRAGVNLTPTYLVNGRTLDTRRLGPIQDHKSLLELLNAVKKP